MEDLFPHLWQFHLATGAFALSVAVACVWAERRRIRRVNLDAVGFMPWTAIYLIAFVLAVVFLGLSLREWLAV